MSKKLFSWTSAAISDMNMRLNDAILILELLCLLLYRFYVFVFLSSIVMTLRPMLLPTETSDSFICMFFKGNVTDRWTYHGP